MGHRWLVNKARNLRLGEWETGTRFLANDCVPHLSIDSDVPLHTVVILIGHPLNLLLLRHPWYFGTILKHRRFTFLHSLVTFKTGYQINYSTCLVLGTIMRTTLPNPEQRPEGDKAVKSQHLKPFARERQHNTGQGVFSPDLGPLRRRRRRRRAQPPSI